MKTYRFAWDAMVTPGVVARVAQAAQVPLETVDAERAVLASILAAAGGLPVMAGLPTDAERTAFGLGLLHEAVCHVLAAAMTTRLPARRREGYALQKARGGDFASVAVAIDRVSLNCASPAALATATGMTASLSEKVVEERRARGAFRTAEELDQRMRGVDVRNRDRIAGAVLFDAPADLLEAQCEIANDFDADLGRLLALQDAKAPDHRVASALEMIAAVCSRDPHPATAGQRIRVTPKPIAPPAAAVDAIGVLANDDYYAALLPVFGAAKQSIDVCMFHIACPSETHPTRKLLDALGAARARGVAVRVLMDQDRKTDPYMSTIINTPAKKLLEEARVQVRFDTAARLLHSKFIVIDGAIAVIGSHNWSAGSFFNFDDLTLLISSAELAGQLSARFATLWK